MPVNADCCYLCLAFIAFLMLVMLWYINENLARLWNELSWFGKRAEKADRDRDRKQIEISSPAFRDHPDENSP